MTTSMIRPRPLRPDCVRTSTRLFGVNKERSMGCFFKRALPTTGRSRAACEYRTHVDHLPRSPLQIQLKNVLFAWCGKPATMLTYMIRAVAPNLTSHAAEPTDDAFFDALCRAWKAAPDSFGCDEPHGWWRRKQAQPSVRRGGANAASLHDFRDPAYLGSIADTLPTLLLDEHSSDIIDTPACMVDLAIAFSAVVDLAIAFSAARRRSLVPHHVPQGPIHRRPLSCGCALTSSTSRLEM